MCVVAAEVSMDTDEACEYLQGEKESKEGAIVSVPIALFQPMVSEVKVISNTQMQHYTGQ